MISALAAQIGSATTRVNASVWIQWEWMKGTTESADVVKPNLTACGTVSTVPEILKCRIVENTADSVVDFWNDAGGPVECVGPRLGRRWLKQNRRLLTHVCVEGSRSDTEQFFFPSKNTVSYET